MDNIKISNTSYSIEENWLELAKRIYGTDDISLLKAGLFGYTNEIMAQEIKSNVFHRNFIYDEHFLNTATTVKSIYNFAKQRNYNIKNAKPSHMSINLSVSKEDIINSSGFKKIVNSNGHADSDDLYEYIIDNDIYFLVNKYTFRLPYNVQLLFNYNNVNKTYSVTAKYLIEGENQLEYAISDPYIKTWEDAVNGKNYIFLKLEVFQITKKTHEYLVTSEDFSSSLFYRFEFEKKLAFFNVYYEYNNERFLLNSYFNNSYIPLNNEKFCYYSLINSRTLEISFSSLFNSFRPKYGSKLIVEIYQTDGALANFEFDGEITVNYSGNENSEDLSRIIMLVTPISDCSGGEDQPNLLMIKNDLIRDNLARNNIITDMDLDYYFNNLNRQNKINGSSIKFIKKRNDVLRRLHSAFLLLRSADTMIVPTRTINNISIDKIGNDISINEKSVIIYDTKNKNYFMTYSQNEIDIYNKDPNYLLYSIPFLVNIKTNNGISSCKYYKTSVDKEILLNSKYINPSIPFKFLITSLSVSRTSIRDDVYNVRLTCSTTINMNEDLESVLKLRGILKSKEGEPYGYFEFNKTDENNLTYEGKLAVDTVNSFHDGKINIYNSLYNVKSSPIVNDDGYTSIKNCYLPEDVNIEIQVFYKSNYSNYLYNEASSMPDLSEKSLGDDKNFATLCVYNNINSFSLFKDMNMMMESLVKIENNKTLIKSIPVVEYNFFKLNNSYIFYALENYISLLDDNMDKLENLTNIDLKFFNTHGESKYFCSNISKDQNGNNIYTETDRIDCTLDMNIYVNRTVDSETDIKIKKFISDFIESCNEEAIFPISNLQRQLENNFDIIKYSELNSLNGIKCAQKLIRKYNNLNDIKDKRELDDFVPEFLNLRKQISSVKNETGNIENKVYKYDISINYI